MVGETLTSTARMIVASVALLAAFLAWASIGEIDVSSTAMGEVIPSGKVKTVQHLEGGIVRSILIAEGQRVKRGDSLLELDPVKAYADFDEISTKLLSLRVNIARLEAEAAERSAPDFPEDLINAAPRAVEDAINLFETRRRRLVYEISTLESQVTQRQQELTEIHQRAANSQKTLAVIAEQVAISEKMLKQKLTSRMVHLDLVSQHQVLISQIEADQAAIPRLDAALREATERQNAAREGYIEQARTDMAEARNTYDEISQRASKYESVRERTVIKAPVDGLIKSVAVTTEGGVVQPGATVVEIVPEDDRLEIEARLAVQDVGFVHVGQAVRVTLNSSDAALFAPLDGEVVLIGPDAVVDSEGHPYYRIRIRTDERRFSARGLDYDLQPGMQVGCTILIARRTVLQYILGPWLQTARLALEER